MSKTKGERYTIAVDFDGVLHSYSSPWVDEHTIPDPPVPGAIKWLNGIANHFNVVIFTTRGRTWRGRLSVLKWLWSHGASSPDAETWSDLPFKVTNKKPPALVYLDDRAIRFDGNNFPTAQQIHAARPWNRPREATHD